MNIKKILAAALTAAVAAGSFSVVAAAADPTTTDGTQSYGLASSIQEGTILHCFDWKYSDIKAELPNIAKAGFTSVQTSPAQEPVKNDTWKLLYQPLGFAVKTSALGTKDELKELCAEADKYGIKVIVDVVANHLAGGEADIDKLDPPFDEDEYWHNTGKGVSDSSRTSVTHGDLGEYGDLNSENETVQQAVAAYVAELKELGVDGIRWDAAKHIGLPSEDCGFWPAVIDSDLYNYGEILNSPGGSNANDTMKEYTNYMSVTDNGYGNGLRGSFQSGKAPTSTGNWANQGISADKLVYWGESHDTYSNADRETTNIDQNIIDRAYAVVAAREGATSLYLSRPGTAEVGQIMAGDKGTMHFTSAEVAAVNHFHNAMVGKEDSYAVTNNVAVVTRKDGGAVIVCGKDSGSVSVENAGGFVPAGTYKDEITGNEFTVTADKISGTVGDSGIAVVYNSQFAGRVEADPVTGTEFEGTLKVTLKAIDVTNAKYTTSEGDEGSYNDGDTITVGSKTESGEVTVTLTGVKADGTTVSAEYKYNKFAQRKDLPKLENTGVIFDNSEVKWNKVYAYIYDENTFSEIVKSGEWPGVEMTAAENGLFTYELPETFKDCKDIMVIFTNNAGTQFPGANEDGLTIEYGEVKYFDPTSRRFTLVNYDEKTDDNNGSNTDNTGDNTNTDDNTGKTDDNKDNTDNTNNNTNTNTNNNNNNTNNNTDNTNKNNDGSTTNTSDASMSFAGVMAVLAVISAAAIAFTAKKKREQ